MNEWGMPIAVVIGIAAANGRSRFLNRQPRLHRRPDAFGGEQAMLGAFGS